MPDPMSPKVARLMLGAHSLLYERLATPLLFKQEPEEAHRLVLRVLARCDTSPSLCTMLALARDFASRAYSAGVGAMDTTVGGVRFTVPCSPRRGMTYPPLILSAGFVKGIGFDSERDALAAVKRGENIIPGWRSMPALLGAVEFGSYTRYPRLGNPGTVMWRDPATRSLQNRVGLRNPGARAAAAFLGRRRARGRLPQVFGINIAPTPGREDPEEAGVDIAESISWFQRRGVRPSWYTLNLSCPNTQDDPGGRQTEVAGRAVCEAALDQMHALDPGAKGQVPLWFKLGPDLSEEQYTLLLRVAAELGVGAVVASNTYGASTPEDPGIRAGVSGGRLHAMAVRAVRILADEKRRQGYPVDIVACGGVMSGAGYRRFIEAGASAVQYWSALVFRGPMAAQVIRREYLVSVGRVAQ